MCKQVPGGSLEEGLPPVRLPSPVMHAGFTDEWSYPAQDHDNLEFRFVALAWRLHHPMTIVLAVMLGCIKFVPPKAQPLRSPHRGRLGGNYAAARLRFNGGPFLAGSCSLAGVAERNSALRREYTPNVHSF